MARPGAVGSHCHRTLPARARAGSWVHVCCAFWTQSISFVDSSRMEPVAAVGQRGEWVAVSALLRKQGGKRCGICSKAGGISIRFHGQGGGRGCKFLFHPK